MKRWRENLINFNLAVIAACALWDARLAYHGI
jgi:hypothetical protein